MQMMKSQVAYETLCAVGMQSNLADEIARSVVVPQNVVNYAMMLWRGGVDGERIVKILYNSTATAGILNVRRFFQELGLRPGKSGFYPKQKLRAQKFGFTREQIETDIAQFDKDMAEYARKLMSEREIYPLLGDLDDGLRRLVDMCAVGEKRFYRAGVEFIRWSKGAHASNEEIATVLRRCIRSNGIDIKSLLRLTTGIPSDTTVSRKDTKTIKPRVRMRYLNYARDVYQFFAENARKIQQRARVYQNDDIKLMTSLYKLCKTWDGWSWQITPDALSIPDSPVTLRDSIVIVMDAITAGLPADVQQMMKNIAEHEFARLVPMAQYEYSMERIFRIMGSRRR